MRATPVGLQISDKLTFDDWRRLGAKLSFLATSSAWYIGDWLVYGEAQYTDRYKTVLEAVGLRYQTLRNYAWVARSVTLSRRRHTLSFQHHMEVAKLTPAGQTLWLDRAVEQRWSAAQLRHEVKIDIGNAAGNTGFNRAVVPKITTEVQRLDRWRTAARHSHQELELWIITNLDNAASQDLNGPRD